MTAKILTKLRRVLNDHRLKEQELLTLGTPKRRGIITIYTNHKKEYKLVYQILGPYNRTKYETYDKCTFKKGKFIDGHEIMELISVA